MKTVGSTDIGRRSRNEDSFRFGQCEDTVEWAVVCDGMGGARGGQTASTIAADMVSRKIDKCYNKLMNDNSIQNLLLSAVTTANVAIYDRAKADDSLDGMGTTIVACMVKNKVACIAHVGDSRAYIIRDGQLRQITKDHSLRQEMLDKGQITQAEYDHYPNKNIITRALGINEAVDIDFDTEDINDGDVLILCTDGLYGCVSEKEMLELYENTDFDKLAEKYVRTANDNSGHDNITVVVIKC